MTYEPADLMVHPALVDKMNEMIRNRGGVLAYQSATLGRELTWLAAHQFALQEGLPLIVIERAPMMPHVKRFLKGGTVIAMTPQKALSTVIISAPYVFTINMSVLPIGGRTATGLRVRSIFVDAKYTFISGRHGQLRPAFLNARDDYGDSKILSLKLSDIDA